MPLPVLLPLHMLVLPGQQTVEAATMAEESTVDIVSDDMS